MTDTFFEIGFVQHCGKRISAQQDALWNGERAVQLARMEPAKRFCDGDEALLLAIADGVAVSTMPHLASKFVVNAIGSLDPAQGISQQTIRKIHAQLCDRYNKPATKDTATTVVAARLKNETCQIVNVGDSRAYIINRHDEWAQLSHDHSYRNELVEEGYLQDVDDGIPLYDQLMDCLIANHEEDNFRVHSMQTTFVPWDSLLLCSDGLHDLLSEGELKGLYKSSFPPATQVKLWLDAALKAGAPDNISIILARLKPGGCRHTTYHEFLAEGKT